MPLIIQNQWFFQRAEKALPTMASMSSGTVFILLKVSGPVTRKKLIRGFLTASSLENQFKSTSDQYFHFGPDPTVRWKRSFEQFDVHMTQAGDRKTAGFHLYTLSLIPIQSCSIPKKKAHYQAKTTKLIIRLNLLVWAQITRTAMRLGLVAREKECSRKSITKAVVCL